MKIKMKIKNLHVSCDDAEILHGIDLEVKPGEIHAIMGPNGSGKSTLSKVIAGHPDYEVSQGDMVFEEQSLLEMEPEERACASVFVGFQYPIEIPGVSNFQFLFTAYNSLLKSRNEKSITEESFLVIIKEKMRLMEMDEGFLYRNVNEGFSGGEKKKNEILQLLVLDSRFAVLDETDSGLDIDAMKVVSQGIHQWMTPEKGVVLITHYQRLLSYVKPDFIHVLLKGKIVASGGPELALKLEENGYDWLLEKQELA
jgi:Fe-S cluster assembly ATP-binding protein